MLRLSPLLIAILLATNIRAARADESPSFERDVAPILEQRCLRCHNDEVRKGEFSLVSLATLTKGGESGPAIVPGKADESLLLEMVGGREPAMPKQGPKLTAAEVETLRRWIADGAKWPEGRVLEEKAPLNLDWWSLQAVKRAAIPTVKNEAWARNDIDRFILAKLEEKGLAPSPEADRRTLLRRMSFDLWGLPPSPEEIAKFVGDADAKAYADQVERHLSSIHFGERYARHWLDVVRFAETNGFEMNQERPNAWPYRDYVIRAIQNDLHYDKFLMEQLAGDQLGVDEATGYLVAGAWDQVRSPDPVLTANQRADELHDIVSTLGSSFLGLTVGCARCHNHKFDPISQNDYYALKAIFAGVQHGDRELKPTNDSERDKRIAELVLKQQTLRGKLRRFEPLANLHPAENEARRVPVTRGSNVDRFEPIETRMLRFTILESSQGEPCVDEIEVFTAEESPRNIAHASAGAKATASSTLPGYPIHQLPHIHDGKYGNDFSWISNESGRGWVQLKFAEKATIDHIVWGRDQTGAPRFDDRLATRYRIETSLDGTDWKLIASSDDRLPRGSSAADVSRAVKVEAGSESNELQQKLKKLDEQIALLTRPAMVYAGRMTAPGVTQRLHRGDPTQPREEISAGALAAIPVSFELSPASSDGERRLALAKWITSKQNPLTARVIVNRIWQWHFGEGLVDTPSDFGVNGTRPTHPELLDYLAAELMEHDWSLRHIHRLILNSATYRQASAGRPDGLAKDATSRYLWRYPPRRLEAESLRDSMLAATGKLELAAGGPGFSAFEPNVNYVRVYTPKSSFGPADFRRMIYMTKIRMHVDPTFGAFDCPDGGQVAPKRSRSITPLQALNLLNSAFVLNQSQSLADRIAREVKDDVDAQITRGFQLAFQREPSADEQSACSAVVREQGLLVFCRALLNSNEFVFVE